MTVRRFWQYWVVTLILEIWAILAMDAPLAPVLVRPRVAQGFPVPPALPAKADFAPDAPPGPDAVELQASRMWGVVAQARSASQPPAKPNWSLAGVYGRGGQTRVIVRFEEDRLPVQELKVGQPLPSGDVIAAIESRRVCVLVGKKRLWLPINAVGELVH